MYFNATNSTAMLIFVSVLASAAVSAASPHSQQQVITGDNETGYENGKYVGYSKSYGDYKYDEKYDGKDHKGEEKEKDKTDDDYEYDESDMIKSAHEYKYGAEDYAEKLADEWKKDRKHDEKDKGEHDVKKVDDDSKKYANIKIH